MQIDLSQSAQSEPYKVFMWIRRVELVISCGVLLSMIISIIIRKLYVYNTIRLYMFACIFYFIGMLAVVFHSSTNFTAGCQELVKNQVKDQDIKQYQCNYREVMNKIRTQPSSPIPCGLEAFINLLFYDLGYFFAVLISYNVYCVIKEKHRKFMKTVLKKPLTIIFLVLIIVLHILPFVFMFISTMHTSYGPAGFRYQGKQLILFCGFFYDYEQNATLQYGLLYGVVIAISFCLFIIHFLILFRIRSRIKQFLGLEYLNSKQQFIVKSGGIGRVVFIVQAVNFAKQLFTALGGTDGQPGWAQGILIVINIVFDLYPFFLLFFYWRYTRQYLQFRNNRQTLLSQQ